MAFGSLGASSAAAVDNVVAVLKIFDMMSKQPAEFLKETRELLEDITHQNDGLKQRQFDIAERQAELDKTLAVIQAKQDALNAHIAQLNKIIGA